jgi:hypothetical protein
MAAGRFSEPGTEFGPCADECTHRDCAATRRSAEQPCTHCGNRIGYGERFYDVSQPGAPSREVLAHAICEESVVASRSGEQP